MAKDVDLSSKEWLDIVFDGKNKDFGAYEMRSNSTKRHTRAVIYVVLILVACLGLLILSISGFFSSGEEEGPDASVSQEEMAALVDQSEELEDNQELEELPPPPPPEEEIIQPEEVANEQRVTDLLIVNDDDFEKEKEVKDTSEVMETEAQVGSVDITEGTNDLNKQVVRDEIIAEAPAPVNDEPVSMAMVEQKPQFPGGDSAMYKWLSDHITYPTQAAEEGVEGRVVVQFVIGKDGSIQNVQVVRGRHPALDKEALRLVKSMPNWQPGRNNGQPVKVTYTLPVTFKLQ